MGLARKNAFHSELDENSVRDSYLEVWSDIFEYAENLNGNWLVSQEIFRNKLVPTAEKDPSKFAKWINDMVRLSGYRIKSRHLYAKSLRFIRRFKSLKGVSRSELSKAITEMLNAGINDPVYAKRAIQKTKS